LNAIKFPSCVSGSVRFPRIHDSADDFGILEKVLQNSTMQRLEVGTWVWPITSSSA